MSAVPGRRVVGHPFLMAVWDERNVPDWQADRPRAVADPNDSFDRDSLLFFGDRQ